MIISKLEKVERFVEVNRNKPLSSVRIAQAFRRLSNLSEESKETLQKIKNGSFNTKRLLYTFENKLITIRSILNLVNEIASLTTQRLLKVPYSKTKKYFDSLYTIIEDSAIIEYLIGRGGVEYFDKYDYSLLNELLSFQSKYLKNAIKNGTLRLSQYGNSTLGFYSLGKQTAAEYSPFGAERWRITSKAEHCFDCIALYERGWVPLGELPVPQCGDTQCLGNCRCYKEYGPKINITRGGKDSGFFDHAGRPGKVGGSQPSKKTIHWGTPNKKLQDMSEKEYRKYLEDNNVNLDYLDPKVQYCIEVLHLYGVPVEELDSLDGIKFAYLPGNATGKMDPDTGRIYIDNTTFIRDGYPLEYTLLREIGHYNSYWTIRDKRNVSIWPKLKKLKTFLSNSGTSIYSYGLRPASLENEDDLCADIYATLHFADPAHVSKLKKLLESQKIDPSSLFGNLDA